MSLEDRLYPLLSIYERLPDGVRRGAGFAYRCLPKGFRLGPRFGDFEGLAREGEGWSAEEIREYQFKQLRSVLMQAASNCVFYQRSFAHAHFRPEEFRSLDDLKKVPLLEKSSLQENVLEFVSSALPESQRLFMTTGGSTGTPVGFFLQKGVSRPKEQAFLEAMWRRAGWSEGARVAVIRGHVTSSEAAGKIVFRDYTRNWLMLSSYHLTAERLPEYLDALEKFQPELLHAYPSSALQLAEFLERAGQSWRMPMRALLCGSEQLTLPQKRLLERVFGCRVYRWYGHSERVVLAGEGRESELFHFWPQYGFVEFGPPDAEGLREVIGTSFHNVVMPLIRYRTGDFVRVVEIKRPEIQSQPSEADHGTRSTEHAPEFPWPAVSEVAGRAHEFLVSATGRRISLTAFNMHDEVFSDLYAVQFFQGEPGRAEFRYVPGPQFHTSRLAAIEAGVRRKLGDDFQIAFRAVAETEKTARGKHRWLVSTLPRDSKPEML